MKLHIFRRDLRLVDNTSLGDIEKGIGCFIFDTRQRDHEYFSANAFQFMLQSLEDLNNAMEGKLACFQGKPEDVIEELLQKHGITEVHVNMDYTPFSISRDKMIAQTCARNNVAFIQHHDALLTIPGTVLTQQETPYTVYTPFSRAAREQDVVKPQSTATDFFKIDGTTTIQEMRKHVAWNDVLAVDGGRTAGLKKLREAEKLTRYAETRNIPAEQGTSMLSAHLKFGTLSAREVYWRVHEMLGFDHGILDELYWRDFFTHVAFHFPHVFNGPFRKKYSSITWENDKQKFSAWCEGKTGFPIVDAGMRELTTTGYMHNRVRMITASFLVKDLHIDWRWGEKFFAQHLVDYDPAVNNGNWQWAASTGCDAQPYFRIFNPWRQQERFDPDSKYIKKWVPEFQTDAYPQPVVEHKEAAAAAKKLYE